MSQILNTTVPIYDIDHIYVIDKSDDNAERLMLREARVDKVTITHNGTVSFMFKVAGESNSLAPDDLDIYYNTASYRSTDKKVECTYCLIDELLDKLGIDASLYSRFKANPNASQYLLPTGFIINDKTMVEAIDFPASWEFKRTTITVPGTTDEDEPTTQEIWVHNANFYGKDIYETREDALKNHKIKLLRLNGDEDEV